jgi:hypothetical protein
MSCSTVDSWTEFTDCFTHQRHGQPPDNKPALLSAILADGINLGLNREPAQAEQLTDSYHRFDDAEHRLGRLLEPLAARSAGDHACGHWSGVRQASAVEEPGSPQRPPAAREI